MTNKQTSGTLIDQVAISNDEAWRRYRAVLARNESPQPGDAEELRVVMAALLIDGDRVRRDLATLKQAAELAATLASAADPTFRAQCTEAGRLLEEYQKESRRIAEERERKEHELMMSLRALLDEGQRRGEAGRELGALQRENRALFGLRPRESQATQPTSGIQDHGGYMGPEAGGIQDRNRSFGPGPGGIN